MNELEEKRQEKKKQALRDSGWDDWPQLSAVFCRSDTTVLGTHSAFPPS